MSGADDSDLDATEMSFGDHLDELRRRLVRCVLATVVAFFVVFAFHETILLVVAKPYLDATRALHIPAKLVNLRVAESFVNYMKLSIAVALLVVAPVWIWHMWSFVSVGLYRNERRWVHRFAPLMIVLFAAGVTFGYTTLIPIGLEYLLSFRDPRVLENTIQFSEYLSFFTTLTLMLGLMFELPVVLALLTRLEIVDIATLRSKRRHFILGAFIVAAIVTPPDVITQVLMAIPLVFLYELGIGLSWLALGSERPPIAWSTWRKRGAIALLVAIGAWLLQDGAVEGYHRRLASQRIRRAGQDLGADAVPYLKMLSTPGLLPFAPAEAVLVAEDGQVELWAVAGDDRAALVRARFTDDRLTRIGGEGEDEARFLLQPSTQTVELEVLNDVPLATWLPQALDVAAKAGEEDAAVVERVLRGLAASGEIAGENATDAGAPAPDDDPIAAWRRLLERHPHALWRRRG